MSNASADADGGSGALRDRDEVLEMLDEAHRKATNGRVYDAEAERVRQGWVRAFAYTAGQYRQLRKDQQLDEIEERLSAIEEADP